MSTNKPKVLTQDDILKRLPEEVLHENVYKAKVIFMGVLKDDPNYKATRAFSVNGRRYSVVDGGISFLPKEALHALLDAVPKFTVHANKKQETDGINHGDPTDQFKKVANPRYDVTIIDEFKIGKDEAGNNILINLTEKGREAELAKAQQAAYAAIRKELEETIREELEEKYRKQRDEEAKAQVDKKEESYPDPVEEIPDMVETEDLEIGGFED
jgi:hypothetical protein